MPRLTALELKNAAPEVREIFGGPLKGMEINLLRSLANSPAALGAFAGAFGALSKGELSGAEREAVALAVSEMNGCGYCIAAHTAIGRGAGLTREQVLSARRGSGAEGKLGALVRFVRAVHANGGRVSDVDVGSFRAAGYGDGAIAEVVANYALTVYTNTFNNLNGTEVDFPTPEKV